MDTLSSSVLPVVASLVPRRVLRQAREDPTPLESADFQLISAVVLVVRVSTRPASDMATSANGGSSGTAGRTRASSASRSPSSHSRSFSPHDPPQLTIAGAPFKASHSQTLPPDIGVSSGTDGDGGADGSEPPTAAYIRQRAWLGRRRSASFGPRLATDSTTEVLRRAASSLASLSDDGDAGSDGSASTADHNHLALPTVSPRRDSGSPSSDSVSPSSTEPHGGSGSSPAPAASEPAANDVGNLLDVIQYFWADVMDKVQRYGGDVIALDGVEMTCLWTSDEAPHEGILRGAAAAAVSIVTRVTVPPVFGASDWNVGFRAGLSSGRVFWAQVGGIGGKWVTMIGGPPVKEAFKCLDSTVAFDVPRGIAVPHELWSQLLPFFEGKPADKHFWWLLGQARGMSRPVAYRGRAGARVHNVAGGASGGADVPDGGGGSGSDHDDDEIGGQSAMSMLRTIGAQGAQALLAGLGAYMPQVHGMGLAQVVDRVTKVKGKLRCVSVLAVHLPRFEYTWDTVDGVQIAAAVVQRAVIDFGGVMWKILVTRSGTTFLAVRGLPQCSSHNDALLMAKMAMTARAGLAHLSLNPSFYVACGPCYVGFVGSRHRRELVVAGRTVERAKSHVTSLRPGVVACDEVARPAIAAHAEVSTRPFTTFCRNARTAAGTTAGDFAQCDCIEAGGEVSTRAHVIESLRSRRRCSCEGAIDAIGLGKEGNLQALLEAILAVRGEGKGGTLAFVGRRGIGKTIVVNLLLQRGIKGVNTLRVSAGALLGEQYGIEVFEGVVREALGLRHCPQAEESVPDFLHDTLLDFCASRGILADVDPVYALGGMVTSRAGTVGASGFAMADPGDLSSILSDSGGDLSSVIGGGPESPRRTGLPVRVHDPSPVEPCCPDNDLAWGFPKCGLNQASRECLALLDIVREAAAEHDATMIVVDSATYLSNEALEVLAVLRRAMPELIILLLVTESGSVEMCPALRRLLYRATTITCEPLQPVWSLAVPQIGNAADSDGGTNSSGEKSISSINFSSGTDLSWRAEVELAEGVPMFARAFAVRNQSQGGSGSLLTTAMGGAGGWATAAGRLPVVVEALIREDLEALTADVEALLCVAAVVGTEFDTRTLRFLFYDILRHEADVHETMEVLLERGFVKEKVLGAEDDEGEGRRKGGGGRRRTGRRGDMVLPRRRSPSRRRGKKGSAGDGTRSISKIRGKRTHKRSRSHRRSASLSVIIGHLRSSRARGDPYDDDNEDDTLYVFTSSLVHTVCLHSIPQITYRRLHVALGLRFERQLKEDLLATHNSEIDLESAHLLVSLYPVISYFASAGDPRCLPYIDLLVEAADRMEAYHNSVMIRLATEAVVRACLPSTRSIQIARWHYNLARVFLNNHNYDAAFVHLGHALGLASTQDPAPASPSDLVPILKRFGAEGHNLSSANEGVVGRRASQQRILSPEDEIAIETYAAFALASLYAGRVEQALSMATSLLELALSYRLVVWAADGFLYASIALGLLSLAAPVGVVSVAAAGGGETAGSEPDGSLDESGEKANAAVVTPEEARVRLALMDEYRNVAFGLTDRMTDVAERGRAFMLLACAFAVDRVDPAESLDFLEFILTHQASVSGGAAGALEADALELGREALGLSDVDPTESSSGRRPRRTSSGSASERLAAAAAAARSGSRSPLSSPTSPTIPSLATTHAPPPLPGASPPGASLDSGELTHDTLVDAIGAILDYFGRRFRAQNRLSEMHARMQAIFAFLTGDFARAEAAIEVAEAAAVAEGVRVESAYGGLLTEALARAYNRMTRNHGMLWAVIGARRVSVGRATMVGVFAVGCFLRILAEGAVSSHSVHAVLAFLRESFKDCVARFAVRVAAGSESDTLPAVVERLFELPPLPVYFPHDLNLVTDAIGASLPVP